MGDQKDVEDEKEVHVCNPDTVATIRELAQTTKPCPNCQVPIFKVNGCFAADQPILMYDGTVRMSQTIQVGDELMGDDGEKRIVLNLFCGDDDMYEVRQHRGESYRVNSKHKLVLKSCDDIREITIDEYLRLPAAVKTAWVGFKSLWKEGRHPTTSIEVRSIGRGPYFGWSVDGNRRFLAPDHTVLRNCDQMWCVKCNVAYSWNTGEIERGVIHNPHYYEHLRTQQGGIPRNPNEERNGGMPPAVFLRHLLHGSFEITRMYRRVNHLRMVHLLRAPTPFDNVTNRDLRIQYLLQQISEEEFKDKLQRREKERSKSIEAREILDMYCNIIQDLLQDLYRHGAVQNEQGMQQWSGEMATMVMEQEETVRKMSIEAYEKMNHKYQSRLACPLKEI